MASDVEAMTQLADWLLRCPVHPPTGWQELMVRAISALEPHATDCALVTLRTECDCRLEAREARLKVEGRMSDGEVAKGYESVCSAGIDRPGTIAAKLKADHLAARASEAALSERVATLERVLTPFAKAAEALDGYRGEQPDRLVQMHITAYDCSVARRAISPPSKPETP